ncbi:PREDICTED: ankyrin repeat domain-containing protein SOWAHB [Gekko japonicus]|uniref:Ankyrin repeat domain-containing protein SOWAHB n=1 Tax=Gekko japonicus TaxID=146911 RepID=A0ABM1KS59_GEKJA|nr:PREDICTED: ankyrin repeat domain-containing protein SOWAHB [Gekko japonicus]
MREPPLDDPGSRAQQQRPRGQGRAEGAPRAPGGECLRNGAEKEERPRSRTCGGSAQDLRASPADLGGRSGARRPPSPTPSGPPPRCALLGDERRSQTSCGFGPPAGDLPALPGGAPQANGPPFPVGAPGALPPSDGLQQRIREWVARAHGVALQPSDDACEGGEEAAWSARPSPPISARSPCPSPSLLDSQLGPPPPGLEPWRERLPVFRSIRCQLALQDLDEFLEQESPASEDSSSASGGSDSCRGEGEPAFLHHPTQNGPPIGVARTPGEEPPRKPRANGQLGPPMGASGPPRGPPSPGHLPPLGQITRGSSSEDELLDKDSKRPSGHLPKAKKLACLPSPNLDAPLSPQVAHRQGSQNSTLSVEGLGLATDGSPEPRSSLVPLEPREHTWLVKVAVGSWLQVRALFLEDPHLATRKDFISGYTVLHWLAKHGNAQVLLDFVTGARKAGVALDVNVKSGCGYTPLHLAAMHGHQLVIRLLVQKLQCQIQVRDSSGKRPWQYLSSSTSGEIWQLLGAPKGKTIFPAHPIARRGKSPDLARKISRQTSLAAYLKPQHIKWKMANKYPALQEREEYSD